MLPSARFRTHIGNKECERTFFSFSIALFRKEKTVAVYPPKPERKLSCDKLRKSAFAEVKSALSNSDNCL